MVSIFAAARRAAKLIVQFGCFVALVALGLAEAAAQGKLEQTDVSIVATRDTQVGVQLAIADALGYFKDEGLQVTPRWVQSGDDVVQLLGAGAVPIGCASTFGRRCSPRSASPFTRSRASPTWPARKASSLRRT